jgi:hypothetical protein
MALINFATREITSKVVYFGAQGSECGRNLRELHDLLRDAETSHLHRFGVEKATPSWVFEAGMDELAAVPGFRMRFRVYSLPSEVEAEAHRQLIMSDVDGIVFVADARPEMDGHNLEAILALERTLKSDGIEMAALPMVLQVNHSDRREARPARRVVFDLNPYGFPVTEHTSNNGAGARSTLQTICSTISERIRDSIQGRHVALHLTAMHRDQQGRLDDAVREHVDQLIQAGQVASTTLDAPIERDNAFYSTLPVVATIHAGLETIDAALPIHLVDARVTSGRIHLDLVVDRPAGGAAQRVQVVLDPTDDLDEPSSIIKKHNLTTDLPPFDIPAKSPLPPVDRTDAIPSVMYGMAGVVGGVVTGLLLSYLFL